MTGQVAGGLLLLGFAAAAENYSLQNIDRSDILFKLKFNENNATHVRK